MTQQHLLNPLAHRPPTATGRDTASPEVPDLDDPLVDVAVPDNPLPKAAEPDSPLAAVAVPDSPLPEAAELDGRLPDAAVPDRPLPDVTEPDGRLPAVPDNPLPKAAEPDGRLPAVDEPDSPLPDVTEPDGRLTSVAEPHTQLPNLADRNGRPSIGWDARSAYRTDREDRSSDVTELCERLPKVVALDARLRERLHRTQRTVFETAPDTTPSGGTLLDVIPLPETEKVLLIVAHVVPASSGLLEGTGPSASEAAPTEAETFLRSASADAEASLRSEASSLPQGPSASERFRGVQASALATDSSGAEVAQAECLEALGTPLRASTTAPKTNAIDAPGPEAGPRPPTREQANHPVAAPAVRTVSRPTSPALGAVPAGPVSRTPNGLWVDRPSRHVWVDGREVGLTFQEFELLGHLTTHPWTVFSRTQLMQALWPAVDPTTRTVDVHVHRLRRKLGRWGHQLVTVRRVGYVYRPHLVNRAAQPVAE
jgi:hypothetical protein